MTQSKVTKKLIAQRLQLLNQLRRHYNLEDIYLRSGYGKIGFDLMDNRSLTGLLTTREAYHWLQGHYDCLRTLKLTLYGIVNKDWEAFYQAVPMEGQ